MPAKAGIHLRFRWQANEDLDSGLRRNDEKKSLLLVHEFRTPRLGAEGHSVYRGSRETRTALIAAPTKHNTAAVKQAKRNPRMKAAKPIALPSAANCLAKDCNDDAPVALNCAPTIVVASAAPME
ncbi:hypothetical protein D3C83_20770 [compost metagenome]